MIRIFVTATVFSFVSVATWADHGEIPIAAGCVQHTLDNLSAIKRSATWPTGPLEGVAVRIENTCYYPIRVTFCIDQRTDSRWENRLRNKRMVHLSKRGADGYSFVAKLPTRDDVFDFRTRHTDYRIYYCVDWLDQNRAGKTGHVLCKDAKVKKGKRKGQLGFPSACG